MEHLTYESYTNPDPPPLNAEIRRSIYSHQPHIGWSNLEQTLAEYVLSTIDIDESWPEPVQQWHARACRWIPPHVFGWWVDQFSDDDGLHAMAPEWWQYRTHRFVAALIDDEPIGGVALVPVKFSERGMENRPDLDYLFYELRGLVVAPRYRRTAAKIGTHLVASLVQDATLKGETPTFAITNNPNAARIFANTGASNDCDHPLFKHLDPDVMQGIVCWCSPRANPVCGECPLRPNRLWWWPADGPIA